MDNHANLGRRIPKPSSRQREIGAFEVKFERIFDGLKGLQADEERQARIQRLEKSKEKQPSRKEKTVARKIQVATAGMVCISELFVQFWGAENYKLDI